MQEETGKEAADSEAGMKAGEKGMNQEVKAQARDLQTGQGREEQDSGQGQDKAAITAAGTWRIEAEDDKEAFRRYHSYPKLFKPLRINPILRCQRQILS